MNICTRPLRRRWILLSTLLALLAGCATTETAPPPVASTPAKALAAAAPAPAASAAPTSAAATPAPLPPLLPYEEAIARAAAGVIDRAPIAENENVSLVIDPLIDGVSKLQTRATGDIEQRLVAHVKAKHRNFEVKPFTARGLADAQYLLIGTFTPINQQGKPEGERESYRFCLAMIDLRSSKLVSKLAVRAQFGKIDATPLAFFQDAPLWTRDATADAYIKSCQGSKVGDTADAAYVAALADNATLAEGIRQYNTRKYREALELFDRVSARQGANDPRALTGLYLANLKLNRRDAANQVFGQLVDYGFANGGTLAVLFQFARGAAQLASLRNLPQETWLKVIAQRMDQTAACAEVAGHSSRDGPEAVNERLSSLRAEHVRARLVEAAGGLDKRLIAVGYGSREAKVGTAKGDASDALDRRVEIRPIACK